MKIKSIKIVMVTLLLTGGWYRGYSQGSFVNLNFENPVLPLVPVGFQVPIANAIPGWQGYIGLNQVDMVYYNAVSTGAAAISLHGPGSLEPIFQGNYSVILQAQFGSGIPVPALTQTGLIPATAKSIRFYSDGVISVSFASQTIPVSIVGSGPGYSIFGGDISAFENVSGELRLQGGGKLDNIFFSNQPIPEPRALGLFSLGAVFLGWRWQRSARM